MRLYVGNLSFSTSETDLRALFEQAGPVGSCELVADRLTGQSRGFAFVEMESSEGGAQAIQRFNEFELDGRRMVVNEARPRDSRAGGFGGGYAGGGRPSGGGFPGGGGTGGGYGTGFDPGYGGAPAPGRGAGAPGGFGAKRKSGKGSRRNARSAKRDRKACW